MRNKIFFAARTWHLVQTLSLGGAVCALLGLAFFSAAQGAPAPARHKDLQIYFVDVEGGQTPGNSQAIDLPLRATQGVCGLALR